ncbi:PDDEXK nuclease domain-containing protein [Niabella yanshanensis]|uniref:PDDEXK nuclease domain-containing protein n=1 Tax=Niabella yanshanensis TaxID=577386 RepID=A0ABZ0W229_9BACT|nr:PDDEXK nuclease domain-containing protein [Niabella yanshanensis]WQD37323.1 PDDEXK nuclease domain-containing protein [Niabella yanshanensis]
MDFKGLLSSISKTHVLLQQSAVNAVNRHITLRNWLIGFYIVEYEQKGDDRARYGDLLLEKLARRIKISGLSETNLKNFRRFYLSYSSIGQTVSDEFQQIIPIGQTVSDLSKPVVASVSASRLFSPVKGITAAQYKKHIVQLFATTSFSHFTELIKIDDAYKRLYYELLQINTQPSVRDLRRAIHTLSYERTGLSQNKKLSLQEIEKKIKPAQASDVIKDFYFFDFLQLPQSETVHETELETALLTHLEKFILELGNGFCFEARQKRLLIGDEYFFVDMVFYHRILHCHVLIELKVEKFVSHHASQLKSYLNYYEKNCRTEGDNPPIGILLVTDKNNAMVEYAGATIEEKMFVSKYEVMLPSKKQLENFLKKELKKYKTK